MKPWPEKPQAQTAVAEPVDDRMRVRRHVVAARPMRSATRRSPRGGNLRPGARGDHRTTVLSTSAPPPSAGDRRPSRSPAFPATPEMEARLALDDERQALRKTGDGRGHDQLAQERLSGSSTPRDSANSAETARMRLATCLTRAHPFARAPRPRATPLARRSPGRRDGVGQAVPPARGPRRARRRAATPGASSPIRAGSTSSTATPSSSWS